MIPALVLGAALLVLVVFVVGMYNSLIALKQNIQKAWSNIDVILKQRFDEIPKLVKVCEGYMKYERDTLERVIQARSAVVQAKDVGQRGQAEAQLGTAVRGLLAVAENYPELKASQQFVQLQGRISGLENQLADRREFYNDSVNTYNIRIQQVPHNFIAGMLAYKPEPLFKVAEEDKRDPEIKFNLPS